MGELFKFIRVVVIVGALVTGAIALWSYRDKVKQVLDSVGGVEGFIGSANKFVETVAPMKDFVTQVAQAKRF